MSAEIVKEESTASALQSLLVRSGYFCPEFYTRNYVDVVTAKLDPLQHYLIYGWLENRQPSEKFDPSFYINLYKDTPKDLNPLIVFFKEGILDGRVGNIADLNSADFSKPRSAITNYYHAVHFYEIRQWHNAEQWITNAIAKDQENLAYLSFHADVLRKQAKWWQRIDTLQQLTILDPENPSHYVELAETQEMMKSHIDAAKAYKKALTYLPNEASLHYRLGYVLENRGHDDRIHLAGSAKHYELAISLDKKLDSATYGIGAFHQSCGRWTAAISAFKKTLKKNYDNANLHYRLGMAYDRTYQWELAEKSYRNAIALDSNDTYWHYRLGFVCERQGKYPSAAEAYAYAASARRDHSVYWHYRCAYTLEKSGRIEDACKQYVKTLQKDANAILGRKILEQALVTNSSATSKGSITQGYKASFEKTKLKSSAKISLELDTSQADIWWKVALTYVSEQNYIEAIPHVRQAIARNDAHVPAWHYMLGCLLTKEGRLNEACSAFRNIRIIQAPYGAPENPLQDDKSFNKPAIYTEYFEREALDPRMVLLESFHGASISCNPYAIFMKMLESEYFSDFTYIWVINDKDKIPKYLKKLKNVIFISRESENYLYYIAKSKYLINNNTFPPYFIKKLGQKYLNTWHGTPLKTLGKDIQTSLFEHKNAARNFLQATDIIVPNDHSEKVLIDQHDIRPGLNANILKMGYPRVDLTVNPSPALLQKLREELGIAKDFKVIFYAPTYRGSSVANSNIELDEIETAIELIENTVDANCVVFFKGHHMFERCIQEKNPRINFLPSHIDTNQFLALTDVLITDYSSVAIDFIPTGRPIIFYAYDYEQYRKDRGLYFSLESFYGEFCTTREGLIQALHISVDSTQAKNRSHATAELCPYDKGNSAQEIIDYFFFEKNSSRICVAQNSTINIVAFAGALIPNGITTSITNLSNALDFKKYSLTLAVDPSSVANHPERVQQMRNLHSNVNIIARVGRQNMTIEEKWLNDYFMREHCLPTLEMREILQRCYLRENIRMFGRANYDCLVNFDGYIRFWALLMAQKPYPNNQKSIAYLHNDMVGEWTKRFPNLESVFNNYNNYDVLLSVSKATNTLNKINLQERFSISPEKFEYCDNLIDADKVIRLAEEEIMIPEEIKIFSGSGDIFINVARLSVEKGHEDLILGFYEAQKMAPDSKLVIVGDGPLKHKLQALISSKGLGEKVFLLGRKDNPFKYLKKATCFVFSSKHEGQGLAILEAMILGLPVICTNFPCAYDVLQSGKLGRIVGMAADEIGAAIMDYSKNGFEFSRFDNSIYQAEAINKFYQVINN
ncbi:CDP-glycerol glycerophosphotransferase family protein [Pseudomonas sp. RP23018S]|uniref:CDP-glycerol glycerophosphotransferase family protein n=1 Tax=Pseudomonas sp. RP23018S TaxID=3096037 RepID=UPI002ACA830D|nr:CDP-glycerol glycerophosphotransferase family protein [Pseudomonas sp. RP23018S]MDZ5601456.1 CDP-glycerol glycerophosphotransferase family protein [Pseudomonas sp. RP23018S]